ncbi:MAG: class I SAM-dependent methyltransferase [Bilifractor sp.]
MDETIRYYDAHAAEYVRATRAADVHVLLDGFLEALRAAFPELPARQCRILDFGCGSGRDARYFLERGYAVSALDGSEELCRAAAAYTGLAVKHCRFQEFEEASGYEGIWACASILHLTRAELPDVLRRAADALVPGGVFYTSFKYGRGERDAAGRHYTDLTEESAAELLQAVPEFRVQKMWVTGDVLPGRESQRWLNLIAVKQA